jgi:hypothetical protein
MNSLLARARSILDMRGLDRRFGAAGIDRETSATGTLDWLCRAQDGTPDDGVAGSYALYNGWAPSYPETTGYVLATFVEAALRLDDKDLLDRARRMALWEVDILRPEGSTPSGWTPERPAGVNGVAFNTGQVAIGWAEVLADGVPISDGDRLRISEASRQALAYLDACICDEGYFEGGLSLSSSSGTHSHNLMTSWGMFALAQRLGEGNYEKQALRSAEYYGARMDERAWPIEVGIHGDESDFPRTHALGYHIQGLLETGLLAGREDLVAIAVKMLEAAVPIIEADGFLPGRVNAGWDGGSSWCCLTGSSQFACCYARVGLHHGRDDFLDVAEKLVDYVVRSQVVEHDDPAIPFAVRGSYPFAWKGYMRASVTNWAAKFHIDSIARLREAGR